VKSKYPALNIIVAWHRAVALIFGVTIVGLSLVLIFMQDLHRFGIGMLVFGFVFVVLVMGFAETIQVFLDTERSSRESAENLEQLLTLARDHYSELALMQKVSRKTSAPRVERSQLEKISSLIVQLRSEGATFDQIAIDLQKDGVPTIDGEVAWTAKAVQAILAQT
jgi:hypothetical protein